MRLCNVTHRNRNVLGRLLVVGVSAFVLAAAPPTAALAEEDTATQAGYGVASAFGSLVYAPVKVAYALVGSVVSGLAWVFSAGDSDVAMPILDRSVRGDYVLTPELVRGERPIEFIGRDPVPSVASAPADPVYPPPTNDPAW